MKRAIIIIFCFIIFGCASNVKTNEEKSNKKDSTLNADSIKYYRLIKSNINIQEFLDYFETIDKQNLFIEYDASNKPEKQKGKLIDKKFYPYISVQGLHWYNVDYSKDEKQFYPYYNAYYKFNIADDKIALIIAYPSMYSGSMVSLFTFCTKDTSLTESIELADEVGDAGYNIKYYSWLKDLNKDGKLDVIKSYRCEDYSTDLESTKGSTLKGIRYDSVFYYKNMTNKLENIYTEAYIDSIKTNDGGRTSKVVKTIKRDTVFLDNKRNIIDIKKYRQ